MDKEGLLIELVRMSQKKSSGVEVLLEEADGLKEQRVGPSREEVAETVSRAASAGALIDLGPEGLLAVAVDGSGTRGLLCSVRGFWTPVSEDVYWNLDAVQGLLAGLSR
jgi:hypothetical protein